MTTVSTRGARRPFDAARRLLRRNRGFAAQAMVIVLVCALLIAIGWAIAIERVRLDLAVTIQEQEKENSNLVVAYEGQTARTLKGADQALLRLRHEYERDGAKLDIRGMFARGELEHNLFNNFGVLDAAGYRVVSSEDYERVSLADREYFSVHKTRDDQGLFIGKPVVGRGSGKWTIHLSRRINKPNGSFAGVLYASVDATALAQFYQYSDLGKHGLALVAGLDGIARVRRSGDTTSFGDDYSDTVLFAQRVKQPIGSLLSTGKVDGVPRFISYRTLSEYPLLVAVGTSTAESLSSFETRKHNNYIGAGLASALCVLFAAGLIVTLARQRKIAASLAERDARFRATFHQAAIGIMHVAFDGRLLMVNKKLCALLGYTESELLARTLMEVTHPDDVATTIAFGKEAVEDRDRDYSPEWEKRYVRKNGAVVWAMVAASTVRDSNGRIAYFVGVVTDISARKRAEVALRESQAQFQQLAGNIPEAFWITDLERGQLIYLSPAYEQICGRAFPSPRAAWQWWKAAIHPDDKERTLAAYDKMASEQLDEEYRVLRQDGSVCWVRARGFPVRNASGIPYRVVGTVEDITLRKQLRERLDYQVHHDGLTQLPNRTQCHARLAQALHDDPQKRSTAAVLFLDLDCFKSVNDTWGHAIGDQLLLRVAERLRRHFRAEDMVARLGGDEFAVILSHLANVQDSRIAAQKIVDLFVLPFELNGNEVFVTASIGVALYPDDGEDADTLMRNADAAMYRAKEQGPNNYCFYTTTMNERALEKMLLLNHLRYAVERNELLLHYQPKAHIASAQITGCEALLRWKPTGKSLVSPAQFVPALEDSGLIVPVGEWVIRAACQQLREWSDTGAPMVPISVNVSVKQFLRQDICGVVRNALYDHAIEAQWLELEITESTAMQNAEEIITALRELKAQGVRIAIDDFGTGYSSLSYLKRLPVDTLKLDRSFVADLPDNTDSAAIARAVISMAHSLGLKVVAEGVETAAQLDYLGKNDCDELQGFLFSRPLPAEEFMQMLRQAAPVRDEEAKPLAA